MKVVLFAVFVSALVAASEGNAQSIEFKGLRLGSSSDSVKAWMQANEVACRADVTSLCAVESKVQSRQSTVWTFANVAIETLTFSLSSDTGELDAVMFGFARSSHDQMATALREKYGATTQSLRTTARNSQGVRYPTLHQIWVRDDGLIRLASRSSDADVSTVAMLSQNASKKRALTDQAAARDAQKDM